MAYHTLYCNAFVSFKACHYFLSLLRNCPAISYMYGCPHGALSVHGSTLVWNEVSQPVSTHCHIFKMKTDEPLSKYCISLEKIVISIKKPKLITSTWRNNF